jgi:hexosaminidase
LITPASTNYPGDGPFTLVNGIHNSKGLTRGREFLGFLTDCIAVIDFGKPETVSNVKVHILDQMPSWIWKPQYIEVLSSSDGANFVSHGTTDVVSTPYGNGVMEKKLDPFTARFLKIFIKNWGEIAPGNPGAGNKAWLFVDEIEVE